MAVSGSEEYGSNGSSPFRTRDYWAVTESDEQPAARLSEIFGPGADA